MKLTKLEEEIKEIVRIAYVNGEKLDLLEIQVEDKLNKFLIPQVENKLDRHFGNVLEDLESLTLTPQVEMVRPKWEDVSHPKGYVMCSCGQILQTQESVREHWQLGHFDKVKTPQVKMGEELRQLVFKEGYISGWEGLKDTIDKINIDKVVNPTNKGNKK